MSKKKSGGLEYFSNPTRRVIFKGTAAAMLGVAGARSFLSTRRAFAATKSKVSLAIGWLPVGYFSAYYLGLERGYYDEAGLDLTLNHVTGNSLAFKTLATGGAQFAAADIMSMLLLQGTAPDTAMRSLAVLYAKCPLTLFYLDGKRISTPKDLEGKTVVDSPGANTKDLMPLLAKANDFDASKVNWTAAQASAKVALMLQGKVNVASDYYLTRPEIEKNLQPGQKLGQFMFGDYGVNIYSDGLVTTDKFWAEDPKTCKAFVRATLRSFKDTFADPTAAADAMAKKVLTLDKEIAVKQLKLVAQLAIGPAQVEHGIGYQEPAAMQASYDAVVNQLKQPINRPVTDFYTNEAL